MSTAPARRPVIGVTLDSEPAGGYAKLPWYALRENYCDVVAAAGGLPIALPHEPDLAEHYLALIDGLVVTGGAFDVDPALYGGGERHAHREAEGAPHPVRVGDHRRVPSSATCRCSASAAASSSSTSSWAAP